MAQDRGHRPETRQWRFRRLGPNRYAGTLSDAAGPVAGEVQGNMLHLRYPMKGGVSAEQWIYLQPDGRTALNRMRLTKLGITVGRLDETIRDVELSLAWPSISRSFGATGRFTWRAEPIDVQHYAFLISDAEFDAGMAWIRDKGLTFWADPARSQPGEINHHFGGRGVYFANPDGHLLELITKPYGSEADL